MAREKLYFDGDTIIACTEYAAKYFGVTPQTLANWAKAGCPRCEYGLWDIKMVSEFCQKGAESDADGNVDKMSLSQQKTYFEGKLKEAQLDAANFRNAINRGDYLERKHVVDSLIKFNTIMKRSLLGLGGKLAGEIAHYVEADEVRRISKMINDTIKDGLEQMSVEGVYSAKGK